MRVALGADHAGLGLKEAIREVWRTASGGASRSRRQSPAWPLGEVAMATPAISENALIFRTRNQLLAIADR